MLVGPVAVFLAISLAISLALFLALFSAGIVACATAGGDKDERPDASLRRADAGPRPDARIPVDAGPDATPIGTDAGAGGNCSDNNDCIDIACCDDGTCVLGVQVGDDICLPIT